MKHRVKLDGRWARAGSALAEQLWADGGVRSSVGRWLVAMYMPPSGPWAVRTWAAARFTSRRRAVAHARRRRAQGFKVTLCRWRRGAEERALRQLKGAR